MSETQKDCRILTVTCMSATSSLHLSQQIITHTFFSLEKEESDQVTKDKHVLTLVNL